MQMKFKEMDLTGLVKEERAMKISEIMGLGETQRKIYDDLISQGELDNELLDAYKNNKEELELLIKYQKRQNEM